MNHLKDVLVIFGGISDQNELLNDVFVYSSTENQWYFLAYLG
jgi:N-acetylneuraminic acid mutarotase